MFKNAIKKRSREASFTLLETMIAVFIMSVTVIEIAGIQGNSIYFYEYGSNSITASWLAKRVMSNVEYQWASKDLKELETEVKDVPFEDYPDFQYSLTIKEWKLPIIDMLAGGGLQNEETGNKDKDNKQETDGMTNMVKEAVSQIFGDEILKVAYVKVSWPEGAKRNDISLTYLMPNQKKLDEFIETMKGTYSQLEKPRK